MTDNKDFSQVLSQFKNAKILCIGDVMLDRFIYGAIERISPEAPIPVLLSQREKHMLGGAGNVVANMIALDAKVSLIAVTGDDNAGKEVQTLFNDAGVTSTLVIDKDRPTTVKSRFISGGQQMLRVDQEKSEPVSKETEDALIAAIQKEISNVDLIVLSDYNKGTLTNNVVITTIKAAQEAGKQVIVDPKGRSFTRYNGATIITPNKKELADATGMKTDTDENVRAAAMEIITNSGVQTILVTRGAEGMALISKNAEPLYIRADVREVYDVSGAGDTVISTFATAIASGADTVQAAQLANVAGGIVVGKTGTATVRPNEIEKMLGTDTAANNAPIKHMNKIMSWDDAGEQAERWRVRGGKVGFTNGTFDLIHPGHLSSIRQAKALCDYLIVAVNSDASVKRYKGPTRPIQDEATRAQILSALEFVDMVVIFGQDTPLEILHVVRPDYLIKGGEYKMEEIVGYDLLKSYGGQIIRAEMEEGFSTTNTIKKMAS